MGKKRKLTNQNDHCACWEALTIRPRNSHEEFGNYVSLTLDQIKDDNLIQRTKGQIQIILGKTMAEFAKKQLGLLFDAEGHSDAIIGNDKNAAIKTSTIS